MFKYADKMSVKLIENCRGVAVVLTVSHSLANQEGKFLLFHTRLFFYSQVTLLFPLHYLRPLLSASRAPKY